MREQILSVSLDDDSIDDILLRIEKGERILQIFINAHKINHLNADRELLKKLESCNSVFSPDGIWVQWYARIRGFKTKQRFGGVDVIEAFSESSNKMNFRLFFLGSTKEIVNSCVSQITKLFPGVQIAGYCDGFYEDEEEVLNQIASSKANVLFIALPSPRKEIFAMETHKINTNLKYVAGVGGAFTIFSGDSKRAPKWIQYFGLEWVYRILLEPRRLFRRYWDDGTVFIRLIIKDIL